MDGIKGVIFDYGGTIDTNGRHWAEVLWGEYKAAQVPVDKDSFRAAYVYGERSLATHSYIKPHHNFYDMLCIKVGLQTDYLSEHHMPAAGERQLHAYRQRIAENSYRYVFDVLQTTRPVLEELIRRRYKLVLVSNFYGNIRTVLADFGLAELFADVVESAVVGVRKPDPAIYRMGVEALRLPPGQVLAVGDSFSKDIVPAHTIGCRTAWLKGEGWGGDVVDESVPDIIITDLTQLPARLF
ncbi:MAG: HAD family hydrolase [Prevotella sp.]|nr:HAD family hydrolase [Prevotella sp.]